MAFMDILSFLLYCMTVTLTPGPTNIAVLSISTNTGIRKTFRYILGVLSAMLLLLCVSAFFNHLLTSVLPGVVTLMRYAGCLYMLYLAWQVLRMHGAGTMPGQAATYLSGFTMQFVNPKVWLLTMTVIPSYIMPYYTGIPVLLGFALLVTAIAAFSVSAWALFGILMMRFLNKHQKAVTLVLALLLVYSAIEVSGLWDLLMR